MDGIHECLTFPVWGQEVKVSSSKSRRADQSWNNRECKWLYSRDLALTRTMTKKGVPTLFGLFSTTECRKWAEKLDSICYNEIISRQERFHLKRARQRPPARAGGTATCIFPVKNRSNRLVVAPASGRRLPLEFEENAAAALRCARFPGETQRNEGTRRIVFRGLSFFVICVVQIARVLE